MLYTVLAALILAAGVFVIGSALGKFLVQKIYMSDSAVASRKEAIVEEFSAYARSRQIKGVDSIAIARWTESHEYVTVFVYKDKNMYFRAKGGKAEAAATLKNEELMQYKAQFGMLYTVDFADGTYQIAVSETSQTREYALLNIVSLFLASVTFLLVLLNYTGKLKNRIIKLSRQAKLVGAGALDAPIVPDGEDELSSLAFEMDAMRNSVIERTEEESRAWQANAELITAVSHDIRTPMTSLIGYLDLLNHADASDTEKINEFSDAAYRKAMELKDLTDELFKYFLVFGKSSVDLSLDVFDVDMLLPQMIEETVFDIADSGFNAKTEYGELCGSVCVDPVYLKRVFSNIESNIRKYADISKPVLINCSVENGNAVVTITNSILKAVERVESTKIGIRTCNKIMSIMKGGFETAADENAFKVTITLPITESETVTE